MPKDSNCKSCGLCCIYYPSTSIEGLSVINEEELTNIPKNLYKKKKEGEGYYFLSKRDTFWKSLKRCKSLEGNQCNDVFCKIYENRPSMCSDFVEGSLMCNKIRYWGGLSPISNDYVYSINELPKEEELKRLTILKILLENGIEYNNNYEIFLKEVENKIQELKNL